MVSAEKISAYIERNGLTDMAFEELCELPKGFVHKWKNGIVKPGLVSLQKIADHTKIPLQKWLDDKD